MKCTTDSTWCDHPGVRGGSTVLHLLSLQLAVTNRERPGQRMPGAVGFAVAVADLAGDAPAPRGMIGGRRRNRKRQLRRRSRILGARVRR